MNKHCPKCGLHLVPQKKVKINFHGDYGMTPIFTYRNGFPFAVFLAIFIFGYQFINYSVELMFFIACVGGLIWVLMVLTPKTVYLCKKCNLRYVGSQLESYDPASHDWEDV